MKKRLGVLLVLVLALTIWCGVASASETGYILPIDGVDYPLYEDGDWWYYIKDQDLVLYSYRGSSTDIIIPSTLDNKPLKTVSSQVFYQNTSLTSVILSDGIVTIGDHAFSGCSNLSSVSLGNSIKTIGTQAFMGTAIESLNLPDSLESIDKNAFRDCNNLSSVYFGEGLQTIGSSAFQGTALSSVSFPDSLISVGNSAFINLSTLKTISFGKGLQSIDTQAFYGTGITSVTLPDSLTSIGRIALYSNTLKEIDIPDSVTDYPSDLQNNPIVAHGTIMVVGKDTNLLADILDAGLSNYRIRGEAEAPEVTTGSTVSERVNAIVAEVVTSSMSDYEKALRLHDYLTQHAQYDNPTYLLNNNSNPDAYEAAGVLLRGYGVCDSYAKAYNLLMDKVGIPCIRLVSKTHAWNMIQIDGQWIHVDCTWDDPTLDGQGAALEPTARSGRERHDFFGLTDYAIQEVDEHQWISKPYTATDYTLNYSYIHGGLNRRITLLVDAIETKLNAGETSFTIIIDDFNNDRYNPMDNRLCVEAAEDIVYFTDTGNYAVSLSLNSKTNELTCYASPHKEKLTFPAFALSTADTFALPGEVTVEGVAQISNNIVSFTGPGKAGITAETEYEIYVYDIVVQNMDTVAIHAEVIEEEAFEGIAAERIVIGSEVQSIGANAFAGCDQLKVLRFDGLTDADFIASLLESNDNVVVFAPADSPIWNRVDRDNQKLFVFE